MKRLIILESNLIKPYGHVIEFPTSIAQAAESLRYEMILVSNKNIALKAKEELRSIKIINEISNTCFENLDDEGEIFQKDLERIDDILNFSSEDIIFCETSYTNQLYGITKFLSQNDKNIKFNIWFHQIYPPQKVFNTLLDSNIRKNLETKLILSLKFSSKKSKSINIFTTEADDLKNFITTNFKGNCNSLPLPFNNNYTFEVPVSDGTSLSIGFLGDGRYEKGGLVLLKSIDLLTHSTSFNNLRFYLQIINPRGYSDLEKDEFDFFRKKLQSLSNIRFIDNSLSTVEYYQLFRDQDILVFPYNPESYDKRVSAIFLQALSMGIPSIVSNNTWLSGILEGLSIDTMFPFAKINIETSKNLNIVLQKVLSNYNEYKHKFLKVAKNYRNKNNAYYFLKKLENYVK